MSAPAGPDAERPRTPGIPGLKAFGKPRLRLGHKFVLTLMVAALLPVAVAAMVTLFLVLDGLESGVRQQTSRTLQVGINLVLRNFKDVFDDALRIAVDPRLAAQLREAPDDTQRLLDGWDEELPSGLLVIADVKGRVIARRAVGVGRSFAGADVVDGADSIGRALGYERRLTLEPIGEGGSHALAVRAAVPVVDDTFRLRGAVVLTVPLDAEFADVLKSALSADVVLFAGTTPIASSFVASDGRRRPGFAAPPSVLPAIQTGRSGLSEVEIDGRSLSAGFAPLVDQDGRRLGMLAVAVDEQHLVDAKQRAFRILEWGAALATLVALLLAGLLSRALVRPLAHLHEMALAVARGELDTEIRRETSDEIGDLADALSTMTRAVRENQERLAARMREITTLHEIGRAVSSVLGLDDVLRRICDQLAVVLEADKTALLFAADHGLRVGAAVHMEDGYPLRQFCQLLYWWDGPLLLSHVETLPDLAEAAAEAGVRGSLLAVPLEQKDDILGLLLVNREAVPFSDNDLRLVATFADHAATAIQNARLYEAVQRSSEELERKVQERTRELTAANDELQRLLHELGQAQAQLVLSERMAGLGVLVAGIAHEVNSPAGAIQGASDALAESIERLVERSRELAEVPMTMEDREAFFALVQRITTRLAHAALQAPAQVRRTARALSASLAEAGFERPEGAARMLAEIGADEAAPELMPLARRYGLLPLVAYLEQHAYLHRNIHAIRTAIRRITRIVGALKGYSHLDQAKVAPADIHEGIENTLIILHHELSHGIVINRSYASLPSVPVYVDELNQVWTNLLQNAVQALGGAGEIVIETRLDGDEVEVSVQDSGPGIPADLVPRIFEPFFTTKKPGQGTGLGLGIARQIVDKHGGRIDVRSRPGCTRFSVRLPVAGPPAALAAMAMGGIAVVA